MDHETAHELTAAYALDALAPDEADAYERHLAACERCQAELASLSKTTGALALAAEPAEPRPELRERILVAARGERPNVEPLPVRRPRLRPAVIAAVAVCAAVAFGAWALVLSSEKPGQLRALAIRGAAGSVVVQPDGRAILIVSGLPRAPGGKTYEAWVITKSRAEPSGLFAGGAGTHVIRLTSRVPRAAVVGVTVEPGGGSPAPTSKPIVVSGPA
jgi:anti-sigma-K factor RskA